MRALVLEVYLLQRSLFYIEVTVNLSLDGPPAGNDAARLFACSVS